jgi:hypothetical protein
MKLSGNCSFYVSGKMCDFVTETKLIFKDDIESCTEAKFSVPNWGILKTLCWYFTFLHAARHLRH